MIVFIFFFGLLVLSSATPLYSKNQGSRNKTLAPGRYLPERITNRAFFNNSCTAETVSVRKEWRSLSHEEKMAFVNAELCIMNLPGSTGLPGALSRFDDFQAAHQQGTNTTDGDQIHYTVCCCSISASVVLILIRDSQSS
jgi:hypothetical protein